jgi:hypothetical protein
MVKIYPSSGRKKRISTKNECGHDTSDNSVDFARVAANRSSADNKRNEKRKKNLYPRETTKSYTSEHKNESKQGEEREREKERKSVPSATASARKQQTRNTTTFI